MKDVSQERFAEMVTWAMCAMANGGGPGKCVPSHCVCGAEGASVASQIYDAGYVLTERGEGTVMRRGLIVSDAGHETL